MIYAGSQVHLEVVTLPRARARGRVARKKLVSCIHVSVVVTIIDKAYCTYMLSDHVTGK